MFEDLGYEINISPSKIINKNFIEYANKEERKAIIFSLQDRKFYAYENKDTMEIDILTFKAIQKQLEELGWLE